MPNQPDTNKKQLGILIPLALFAKIRRAAHDHKMSITDYATWQLSRAISTVELTPEDYEWIADQVRNNINKRSNGGVRK